MALHNSKVVDTMRMLQRTLPRASTTGPRVVTIKLHLHKIPTLSLVQTTLKTLRRGSTSTLRLARSVSHSHQEKHSHGSTSQPILSWRGHRRTPPLRTIARIVMHLR
jgi:hypothetical protein